LAHSSAARSALDFVERISGRGHLERWPRPGGSRCSHPWRSLFALDVQSVPYGLRRIITYANGALVRRESVLQHKALCLAQGLCMALHYYFTPFPGRGQPQKCGGDQYPCRGVTGFSSASWPLLGASAERTCPRGLSWSSTAWRRLRAARPGVLRVGSDELLDKRGVAHVEELAAIIQLPLQLAGVPIGASWTKITRAAAGWPRNCERSCGRRT